MTLPPLTSSQKLRIDPPWVEVSMRTLGKMNVITATVENEFGFTKSCKFIARVTGRYTKNHDNVIKENKKIIQC